ncbi:transcriptional regulator GlxA family with amidase domain [Geodermatophilus bullaregiensis]|uniref:GlxA family transcriptional regulator n=1 Tax=Geodermatophilus bullaregiensis TaxID=1564160 RepID=UPI001EF7783C|nr:helix-turn-helix domain-containing protein [Geodermatophilus bullaregiensis]MBM7805302.1 transcriptional regulator GlxA family with amidase domain [Geodermatophilus bullaregiensis]
MTHGSVPAMTGTPGTTAPHEVVVLALEDVVGLELGLPHRLLGIAEDAEGRPLYRVRVATLDGRPVRTADGWSVVPGHDAAVLGEAGTVVVPGTEGGTALSEGRIPDALRAALVRASGHARLVSLCTGASVLAAAGLLDGRPAATHWRDADRFRRLFPAVRLDPDVLFVDDGDVLTSAGVAAGIDLLLHLVRRDHGSEVANRVARRNVVAPWREGGQAQFVERPLPDAGEAGTAATRAWAVEHLAEPLTLADLAAHARMSVRTFTRRFREETGLSPLRWLAAQRIALARRLLESTDASVDRVAEEAGFGTTASLRAHLRAALGVAPGAYRRTYRGAGRTA